ncbi:low affinity potassium transporter, partial [Ceratobasidium sp. 394]
MANIFVQAWTDFYDSLNFFRLHVLVFTFTPLICAAIFYAANGLYPVSFIDALFNCVSAMTVTGLATVDLSQLTGFQQALLFFQMCIGNPVAVSWLIVYVRRRFFRKQLSHIIAEELKRERQGGIMAAVRERTMSITRSLSRDNNNNNLNNDDVHPEKLEPRPGFFRRFATRLRPTASPGKSPASTVSGAATPSSSDGAKRKSGLAQRLRTDMIRRIETEPQRVDPMGLVVVGGKGKEREGETAGEGGEGEHERARYSGEDVHPVTTGSSRTWYDGAESPPLPEENGESERAHRFRNGTIMTPPLLGPETLSPVSAAFTQAQLGPPQHMESPRQLSDNESAEMHLEAEDALEDDAEGNIPGHGTGHPRTHSPGRSMTDADAPGSHRAGVSHSPVRFKPPPIRVTPGTLAEDRLSPSRARELDHTYTQTSISFSHDRDRHERQPSDLRDTPNTAVGTGEFPRTQTIEFANAPLPRGRTGTRRQSAAASSQQERERTRFRNFTMGGVGVGVGGVGSPGSDAGDTSVGAGASSQGHGGYARGRAGSAG